jgi:hypothetical protein
MTVQSPYFQPGSNPSAVVQNVNANQNPDTTQVNFPAGRQGDILMSQVHGGRYAATARGNTYICPAVGTTGAAILAFGGTTSGVCFGNPVGSGVLMEITRLRLMPATTTLVASVNIGLEYGVVPVSTTYQTAYNGLIGAAASNKCKVWDAVAITAMTYLRTLDLSAISTAWATAGIATGYETTFDGNVVVSQGFALNLATTTSQAANKWFVDVEWMEWPV